MISPTELRIGNYVYHNDNWCYRQSISNFKEFDFQWELEDFMALGESTMDDKNIFPIPLTAEWLLKFGFELSHQSDYYRNYKLPNGIYISEALKDTPEGFGDKKGSFYMGEYHYEIPSVHWLQNYVYFNYNGTELELKK